MKQVFIIALVTSLHVNGQTFVSFTPQMGIKRLGIMQNIELFNGFSIIAEVGQGWAEYYGYKANMASFSFGLSFPLDYSNIFFEGGMTQINTLENQLSYIEPKTKTLSFTIGAFVPCFGSKHFKLMVCTDVVNFISEVGVGYSFQVNKCIK